MAQKQTGRPTAVTVATVHKLEVALRDGFSVERACSLSGISRSTYYAHLRANPEFSNRMALSQMWATDRAKQVVIQAINRGDVKSAQWWLERKAKSEFAVNPAPQHEPSRDLFGFGNKEKFIEHMAKTLTALDVEPPMAEAQ